MSEDNKSNSAWESRYGEIVWAKLKSYPFWPAEILDPNQPRLFPDKKTNKKATAGIGKEYAVRFFGDNSLGFIAEKFIAKWNDENLNTYQNQKMATSLKDQLESSIKKATEAFGLIGEESSATEDSESVEIEEEEDETLEGPDVPKKLKVPKRKADDALRTEVFSF
jgi:hypothetical protein